MLCSISDIYDAMRSQRAYQQAFPTDRILAVLKRNDGTQFDQHLVRRFVQLLGIYPPGNLVRLSTGEVAVVARVHAPDPYGRACACCSTRTGAGSICRSNGISGSRPAPATSPTASFRRSIPPTTRSIRLNFLPA